MGAVWLLLFVFSNAVMAQEERTGTIENLDQDNGFVSISGQRLGFSDRVTQVFIEERLVGAQTLDVGMVVRYTLTSEGILQRIEIIGPNDMLQLLNQN